MSSHGSVICRHDCVRDQLTTSVQAYFWALYSFTQTYVSVFTLTPPCPDYCSLLVSVEIGQCDAFNFVLLNCVGLVQVFCFLYIDFRIRLSISTKWLSGILTEMVLHLCVKLERTDTFILSLPIQEHVLFLFCFLPQYSEMS